MLFRSFWMGVAPQPFIDRAEPALRRTLALMQDRAAASERLAQVPTITIPAPVTPAPAAPIPAANLAPAPAPAPAVAAVDTARSGR